MRRAALVLGLLMACWGCKAEHAPQARASLPEPPRPSSSLSEDPRTGQWVESARFDFAPSPVSHYRTQENTPKDLRSLAELARRRLPSLQFSACLSRAAAAYAAYHPYESSTPPPRELLEFVLHWAGCPDSSAAVRLYYTTEDGSRGLEQHLSELGPLDEATHVGLGVAVGAANPYRWTWAILSTERHFELEPLPHRVDLQAHEGSQVAQLEMRFRLGSGLAEPVVWLLSPEGDMLRVGVSQTAAGHLALLRFDERPGAWWVELLATGALGPQVVALFPVQVNEAFPSQWTGVVSRDESFLRSSADAEALSFALVNRERRSLGLLELAWDEALARVARSHSEEMRDRDFFAHTSPFRGPLGERLAEAAYVSRYSAENIARNDSIYDAHDSLMRSVGHRANILSAMPSVLGIGVVEGEAANGEKTYFVTQNFARPIAATSAAMLLSHVQQRCIEVAGRELQRSAALDRRLSEILAAGEVALGEQVSERVAEALKAMGLSYRQFSMQLQELMEDGDFQAPEALGSKAAALVSMAVAPSPRSTSRQPLWTLLLVVLER